MSNTNYTPGLGNLPYGNTNTNPQASNYANESGYSPDESILIARALKREIFDAAPKKYNALKLLFSKPFEEVNLDEFSYMENTFGRSPLVANAIVAAVAAVPGSPAAQTLTFTAASMAFITPDLILIYPNNKKAVVRTIASATTVTVESQTSDSLPAVAVGDIFATQSTIVADAMTYFSNYSRMDVVERFNYVQFFLRASRWGRIEVQKYINSGTTDYLVVDKEQKIKQLRIDMFNTLFNGQRGEFQISNGYIAKATGGIYPTMVAAGSMNANPTVAGLRSAFEALAFATDHKSEGEVRFIYATPEMLYELSKIFKDPGLRYEPNDEVAKLDLMRYEFGGMTFVTVPCQLFREASCFPAEWKRRILVLDQETISPVKMKGIAAISAEETTLDKGPQGSREGFQDFYVEAQLGVRFHNPPASFWIDVQ